jgi:hypothetical protein
MASMTTTIEILAAIHQDDLRREARERRRVSLLALCRTRILGILPATRACEPCD